MKKMIAMLMCAAMVAGSGLPVMAAESTTEAAAEEALEPGVIFTNDYVNISIDAIDGGDVRILYENVSDMNLHIMPRAVAFNGEVVEWNYWGYNTLDVGPGMKNMVTFTYPGTDAIASMDAIFSAFNDDYMLEFSTDQFHVGAENFLSDAGEEIFNQDGLRIEYLGTSDKGYEYCLTNLTDVFTGYDVKSISVNQFTIDEYDNMKLRYLGGLSNCHVYFTISFNGDEKQQLLADKGIDGIERIDFVISALVGDSEFDDASYTTGAIGCEVA